MKKILFNKNPQNVPKVRTNNRIIDTLIPAPGTLKILEKLEEFESRSMQGQLPIVWDKAIDFSVFDIAGNKWIDFTSTIFVANVGHSNKRVIKSINKVLEKPILSCYAYPSLIRAEYLEKLVKFAGYSFEKAFLLSAGTEATEAALKLMRMNGQKQKKKKLGIICIENNWHGRTLGSQMMSNNERQKSWIGFQDSDIYYLSFPYPWELKNESSITFFERSIDSLINKGVDLSTDIVGFMLETFQGWGAIFYPKEYVQAIESICRKYKISLCFDEMQSGFARTGKNFGFEHYNVTPDLICVGKGMGGGIPISGVIGNSEMMDLPEVGNMSSTHSANPLVCAAASAVIDEIEFHNLTFNSYEKGAYLLKELNKIKEKYSDYISYVFGKGLLAAILFKDPLDQKPNSIIASRICEKCMQKGLLVVHTGRESIKLGPPLTISDEALLEGLDVIIECFKEASLENN